MRGKQRGYNGADAYLIREDVLTAQYGISQRRADYHHYGEGAPRGLVCRTLSKSRDL